MRVQYAHPHFTEHKPGMPPQKVEGKKSSKKTQSQIVSFTLSMNNANACVTCKITIFLSTTPQTQ